MCLKSLARSNWNFSWIDGLHMLMSRRSTTRKPTLDGSIDIGMLLSGGSFIFTAYFWLVKARREKPNLEFYQLSDF